jgi:hypothetical protein
MTQLTASKMAAALLFIDGKVPGAGFGFKSVLVGLARGRFFYLFIYSFYLF